MYLRQILSYYETPEAFKPICRDHFFKPYENTNAFTRGLFYPIEALFEETLPNVIFGLHFIGQALISTGTMLAYLFLGQKKSIIEEKNQIQNALTLSALSLVIAVLAPILEAIRFFTRWSATLKANLECSETTHLKRV